MLFFIKTQFYDHNMKYHFYKKRINLNFSQSYTLFHMILQNLAYMIFLENGQDYSRTKPGLLLSNHLIPSRKVLLIIGCLPKPILDLAKRLFRQVVFYLLDETYYSQLS